MSHSTNNLSRLPLSSMSTSFSPGQQGSQLGTLLIEKVLSREFFDKIKSQMGQKSKPSKAVLQALKHSTNLNSTYKEEIQSLKDTIQRLTQENRCLSALNQSVLQIPSTQSMEMKSNKKLSIVSLQPVQVSRGRSISYETSSFSLQVLKERLRYAEESKAMKQTRFQQLVQRQAINLGQISILKNRNENLENKVQILEAMLERVQKDSTHSTTTNKQQDDGFRIYINQELKSSDSIDCQQIKNVVIEQQEQEQIQMQRSGNHLLVYSLGDGEQNYNVRISCTEQISIEQKYDLQKVAAREIEQRRAKALFDQIDGMIEQQLPNTSSLSNCGTDRSANNKKPNPNNNSFIQIDTEGNANMGQSIIGITMEI